MTYDLWLITEHGHSHEGDFSVVLISDQDSFEIAMEINRNAEDGEAGRKSSPDTVKNENV
jgi:hypothetical protein